MSAVSAEDRPCRESTLAAYRRGVERAVEAMRARLELSMSVDELAVAAHMSRFHFVRVFSRITGVSPLRFLAAIRIQEAKRLLLKTDLRVTDVALRSGYSSLGSFSSTFTDFVGYSPAYFRSLSKPLLQTRISTLKPTPGRHVFRAGRLFQGALTSPVIPAATALAVFSTAVPKSRPIACDWAFGTSRFSFFGPGARGRYLFAVGLLPDATVEDALLQAQERVRVGGARLTAGSRDDLLISLRPISPIEPPVLLAFPLGILDKRPTQSEQSGRSKLETAES
jgi:AraC-like DNA-binding protein